MELPIKCIFKPNSLQACHFPIHKTSRFTLQRETNQLSTIQAGNFRPRFLLLVVETRIPHEPLPPLSALATSRPQLVREVEMVASGVPRRAPHAAVHLTEWKQRRCSKKKVKQIQPCYAIRHSKNLLPAVKVSWFGLLQVEKTSHDGSLTRHRCYPYVKHNVGNIWCLWTESSWHWTRSTSTLHLSNSLGTQQLQEFNVVQLFNVVDLFNFEYCFQLLHACWHSVSGLIPTQLHTTSWGQVDQRQHAASGIL